MRAGKVLTAVYLLCLARHATLLSASHYFLIVFSLPGIQGKKIHFNLNKMTGHPNLVKISSVHPGGQC